MAERENVHHANHDASEELHHKVAGHVKDHKSKYLYGFVIAVLVVLLYLLVVNVLPQKAKYGDTVKVDYTGTLDDGSIFDTSVEKVATDNSVSNPGRIYAPLEFTVGNGQVLKDFEDSVVGMKRWETKKFTIPGDKAYAYNPTLLKKADIRFSVVSTFDIPATIFETNIGSKPEVGKEYETQLLPWKIKVDKIENGNVTLSGVLKIGQQVQLPMKSWKSMVVGLENGNVTLRQDVSIGDMMASEDGKYGKVVNVTDKTFDVDFNLPIAGKDLNFEVTLVEILPKK